MWCQFRRRHIIYLKEGQYFLFIWLTFTLHFHRKVVIFNAKLNIIPDNCLNLVRPITVSLGTVGYPPSNVHLSQHQREHQCKTHLAKHRVEYTTIFFAVVFLLGQSLSFFVFFSLRWQLFPVNKRNPAVCLTVEQLYSYSAGSSDQNKSLIMTKYRALRIADPKWLRGFRTSIQLLLWKLENCGFDKSEHILMYNPRWTAELPIFHLIFLTVCLQLL